ncbi:hypothetical protein J7E62_27605 [Variovorax paradoxus]|nr:hypothetical protein [Variovorax paradoxus]
MTASTKVQWRVQVRKSRTHKWMNKGLFETRKAARDQAVYMRGGRMRDGCIVPNTGYGFGNTRVVRYEKAAK